MAHYSDTLFSHPKVGTIYLLPISDLHVMEISPFKIRNDSALTELIESICKFGIITPIEVRPIKSKGYEIISGARRHYAAAQCNLHSIPAVIVDLDDDDAIIRLVDSNIQRECILPSERALAYKLRMNALKRKAGRPALQSTENSPKISANFRSDDTVGELAGISGDTVRNLISLCIHLTGSTGASGAANADLTIKGAAQRLIVLVIIALRPILLVHNGTRSF